LLRTAGIALITEPPPERSDGNISNFLRLRQEKNGAIIYLSPLTTLGFGGGRLGLDSALEGCS